MASEGRLDVREQPAARYRWTHEKLKSRPEARVHGPRQACGRCSRVGGRDSGQVCEGVDPMGRGRAKAKQTKVARDLKYRSHETDLSALARELHGEPKSSSVEDEDLDSDEYDEWADYSPSNRRD